MERAQKTVTQKHLDSFSVENLFYWNSFITEKKEALQKSVQDAKRSYTVLVYK